MLLIAILTLAILPSLLLAGEPGKYEFTNARSGLMDKGTVFSFHFNEGKGKNVSDSSGNENHGMGKPQSELISQILRRTDMLLMAQWMKYVFLPGSNLTGKSWNL